MNIRAGYAELGVFFAWADISRRLVSQRAILAGLFHEALGLAREIPFAESELRLADRATTRLEKRRASLTGERFEHERRIIDFHGDAFSDYLYHVRHGSRRAAESLIYSFDSIISEAGERLNIPAKRRVGGRLIANRWTIIDVLRCIANWQRHHDAWTVFADGNHNHRVLRDVDLWGIPDVPVAFLQFRRYRAYRLLERDVYEGLEYLVLELGMKFAEAETDTH